jgi:ParB-like chromosome segregation protein Spo0J
LQIKKISIEKLSNDPANARKHDDRNIEAIVGSLRRFGQQKPIVVDVSGVVRAGNGTLEAARRLGWKDIDCVETQLKGSDAIAYAIADNRTAELAEWDDDVLAAQLNGLLADDESLALATGFSNEELEKLVGEIGDIPELKDKPVLDPPVMSWVLIGIPTVRFAEVAAEVERLAQLPDVICETTSNGG